MATSLTVQGADLFHDAHTTILTEVSTTLTVAGAYHALATENIVLNSATLVVQEAWHDHVSDNIANVHAGYIGVDGAALAVTNDAFLLIHRDAWTCSLDPPTLPAMEVSAESGERAETKDDLDLPVIVAGEIRMGIRCSARDDFRLPDMECSAEASVGAVGTLGKRLPAMTASAKTGIRCKATLFLPDMEADVSVSGDLVATLDKGFPGFEISADGSTPVTCSLDTDMPPLDISAELTAHWGATLSKDIPAFKITASTLCGATGTLSGTMPYFELSGDEGVYGDALALDANLPTLVIGGIVAASAKLESVSRFTDYVLRYAR